MCVSVCVRVFCACVCVLCPAHQQQRRVDVDVLEDDELLLHLYGKQPGAL